VAIINQEALLERARKLYTVPTVISAAEFNLLDSACRLTTLPPLYTFNGGANQYELTKLPHLLLDSERLDILGCLGRLNGIEFIQVKLVGGVAELEVYFYNRNSLAQILTDAAAKPASVKTIFPVYGGFRLPAGPAAGQVQVTKIEAHPDPRALKLTVEPIGDYSTYRLGINLADYPNFDPLFGEIPFKFRPGCFNNNCAPGWEPREKKKPAPVIDYLAKDYDSFRHTMMTAMGQRVPSWEGSSEADLDQVLLELFSAAADELSDYQDRVMNEAYLGSARKRVSLARHARLMDYHIHQGNQASTWIALEMQMSPPPAANQRLWIRNRYRFWAGKDKEADPSAIVFVTRGDDPDGQPVHPFVNRFGLYTWDNSVPALAAGSTSADLKIIGNNQDKPTATRIQDLFRGGTIRYLLIQEYLNPVTGTVNGRDPNKRQLLRLITGQPNPSDPLDRAARAMFDPVDGNWFIRVNWREEDRLQRNYCFTVSCPQLVENVSFFHGNLVQAFHGRVTEAPIIFRKPDAPLAPTNEFHYEPMHWGTICRLPKAQSPLAYLSTPPGGDIAPISTLAVTVTPGGTDPWHEVPNLIHSDTSDDNGNHFVVETDEQGQSLIRFGNGVNGKKLPEEAVVNCDFQYGSALDGNIGLDRLLIFDETAPVIVSRLGGGAKTDLDTSKAFLLDCWNPFDVTDGRAPEPAAEIIRRVPEAYRARQLRAVTLKDYVNRAQEVAGVSRAAASYAWTGSWRTVRITIDPIGTTVLSDELRRDVAAYLEAVRLIGEDLEIRSPRFVPLDIRIELCAAPDYWPEDLRFILEQEFSAGFTPDGRMGFFHPDLWTFGQPLYASQIEGRIHQIQGVEHIVSVSLKRWNETTPFGQAVTKLRHNEIIEVLDDPDHLERGFIFFDVQGGRK
jgi:hypothetical protein